MTPETYGIVAGCTSVVYTTLYLIAIWRRKAQPNRVGFWIWTVMGLIIFLSYRKSGGTTIWLQVAYFVNPFLIAIHSLRFGEVVKKQNHKHWWDIFTRLDKTCVAIALASIPLWMILKRYYGDTPSAAIPIFLINILADATGSIPTFEKAWNRPETEDKLAWLMCLLGTTLNLGAVTHWGVADVVWNGWMWCGALTFVLFIYLRPHSNRDQVPKSYT